MDRERLQRANRIVAYLLTLNAEDRAASVDAECGEDDELRALVVRMLDQETAGTFLTGQVHTGVAGPATSAGESHPDKPSLRNYELMDVIGEGGFGIVYRAEQQQPVRREVALKILKPGLDTRAVLARFEAERQVLAMLDHPNIAKVFDAGASEDGRPYFAMELVRGEPIHHYCDRKRLSTRERLALFSVICKAVQHAHQKGVIHRDLKPSNLMITEIDGTPCPKVIDFGIAKATQSTLGSGDITEVGVLMGTPAYMSPEQADQSTQDIDTRSDVYSLGIVLYQLLAGVLPFDPASLRRQGYQEILRILKEEVPLRPSDRVNTLGEASTENAKLRQSVPRRLTQTLRGELDWIVLKALEKERDQRYGSALELGADVNRYLNHEAVLAGPPRVSYRLKKWARRHRTAVISGCLFLAVISGLTAFYIAKLSEEREIAESARLEAESQAEVATAVSAFLKNLITSANPVDAEGGRITLVDVIKNGAMKLRTDLREQPAVRLELIEDLTRTLMTLREFESVPELLDTAIEDFEQEEVIEGAAVTALRIEAAYAIYRAGDYDNSRVRLLKILSEVEGSTEAESRNHGLVLRRLGLLERRAKNLELAEKYMSQAETINLTVFTSDEAELAGFLSDRALVLNDLGRYEDAIDAYERSIAAFEAALGSESPRVAMTLHNLSDPQRRSGDLAAAIASVERADQIFIAAWGPEYGTMQADILMTKAIQANAAERFDDAVGYHERATEIYVEEIGPEHPRVAMSLLNHAVTERERGRCDLAIELFLRARAIHTAVHGAQSRWVERDNEGLAACGYEPGND